MKKPRIYWAALAALVLLWVAWAALMVWWYIFKPKPLPVEADTDTVVITFSPAAAGTCAVTSKHGICVKGEYQVMTIQDAPGLVK